MSDFTRYLYVKAEVEVAMLVSLLNKDKERTLFWVYELYYSAPKAELIMTLWRIYYEFYAMLNPALETYLKKKQTELSANTEHFVGVFVHNLLIRKYTLDVFMLREVATHIEVDEEDAKLSIEERLANKNYEAIAHAIFDTATDCECLADSAAQFSIIIQECAPIVAAATNYFKSQGIKKPVLLKELYVEGIHPCIILMSRIMHYYAFLNKSKDKNGIQMGKNIYLLVEPEEAQAYQTLETSAELPPDRILQKAVIYSPNDHGYNYATLFKGEYERSPNILNDYRHDWLYCAGKNMPIWQERLVEHGGYIDDVARRVCWNDEDGEEAFYGAYGYDPEEQPAEVLHRNIPLMDPSNNITWPAFYKKYTDSQPRLYTPHPDIIAGLE